MGKEKGSLKRRKTFFFKKKLHRSEKRAESCLEEVGNLPPKVQYTGRVLFLKRPSLQKGGDVRRDTIECERKKNNTY